MATFFTSDTHFGDPRVLRLDKRPFATIAEHDAFLIQRWNEVVGEHDEVWHLGDFASSRKSDLINELLLALHGRKHLIIGNNDSEGTVSATGWASVAPYAEIDCEGKHLVLCHYPFRTWNGMGKGAIDLHGHSHGRLKPISRQFDVGVDSWSYRPVALTEILARKRK